MAGTGQEQEMGHTSEQGGKRLSAAMCERAVVLHGGQQTPKDVGGREEREGLRVGKRGPLTR